MCVCVRGSHACTPKHLTWYSRCPSSTDYTIVLPVSCQPFSIGSLFYRISTTTMLACVRTWHIVTCTLEKHIDMSNLLQVSIYKCNNYSRFNNDTLCWWLLHIKPFTTSHAICTNTETWQRRCIRILYKLLTMMASIRRTISQEGMEYIHVCMYVCVYGGTTVVRNRPANPSQTTRIQGERPES